MTERKSYTGLSVESDFAKIANDEAKRNGLTITAQLKEYRDKSIALEQQVDELRTEMRTMIKASVN